MERVQAVEEGVADDDATECGIRRVGLAHVGEGGEEDQVLPEEVVCKGQHVPCQRAHRGPQERSAPSRERNGGLSDFWHETIFYSS